MRPLVPIAVAVLTLGALVGCASGKQSPQPSRATLTAAPNGSGSLCTTDAPCSLDGALAVAGHDQTIALLDGDYGDVAPPSSSFAASATGVTVEPAGDAQPTIGKLALGMAGTVWHDLTFTGGIYLDVGAVGTVLDGVHVDGSGVFVHADDVVISNALIENGTSIDGVQVGGADRLLIENSIVRGFGQGVGSDVHSDCVQLFDSSNVVLRGNYFGACDNAALIFSPGSGAGISNVTVEGNFLQGCVEKTERCSQGTALDLRETTAADVVVRNNTMLDGSVMVDPVDGLVFDRNIVGYVSNCAMPMTNSIVVGWNTGSCDQPDAIGRDGNRQGSVDVVDRAAGDLRLMDPSQGVIEPSGNSTSAKHGYGGATLDPDMAGAGG